MKTLEITSYIGCPNRCHYCPQSTLIKAYGTGNREMSMQDFIEILANVPKDVRIDFSGFSEIFLHPYGADLIRYAYEAGYSIVLYTTLEGFTEEDIKTLKGVKFAEVCFHQWPGYKKHDFERKKTWFQTKIQEGRTAEITKQWLWSRAGNVFAMEHKQGRFKCLFADRDFNHNVVLPNGNVYLCCQDYGLKHRLGNLFETNFDSMNRNHIRNLSTENDSYCICRTCELAQYETQ